MMDRCMAMKMLSIRTFALLIIFECIVYGSADDMARSEATSFPTRTETVELDERLKRLTGRISEFNRKSLSVNKKVTGEGSSSFYIQKDLHEKRTSHVDCRIKLDRQRKLLQEQLDTVSKEATAIEGQNPKEKYPRKIPKKIIRL